jgi:hypothetical protein
MNSSPASIPESYEINAMAGLLTYSRYNSLPIYIINSGVDCCKVIELTAAGQLRIYTVFPFNLHRTNFYAEPKALQMYQYYHCRQIFKGLKN